MADKASDLPEPPVPASLDARDLPFPRDFFIQMAVEQYGVSVEEVTAFMDELLAKMGMSH
jgi:hypothetical protein